jgi:probable rRNA maturation factor
MDAMIGVDVRPPRAADVDVALIEKVAYEALALFGPDEPLELSVVVTDDAEIQVYNKQYLARDRATDVIAFGTSETAGEVNFVSPEGLPRYLGDVMVSYDRAVEQAPEYGHTAVEELHQLVAHGVLHLLGYDDSTDEQKAEMRRMERAVLERIGEK